VERGILATRQPLRAANSYECVRVWGGGGGREREQETEKEQEEKEKEEEGLLNANTVNEVDAECKCATPDAPPSTPNGPQTRFCVHR
jgi:hypothetical protein